MNESLVKYLAGLLDADGSLAFQFQPDPNRANKRFVKIALSLSSSEAIDKNGFVESLPLLTGMGTISRGGDKRQFKNWNVNRRADLEMLLPRLTKHMVIKAQHWSWIFETWRALRSESKTVSDDEAETLRAASKESRRQKVGPLRPKNHPTWAWLAGYLDGDGWYGHRRWKRQWVIHVGAVSHVNDISVLQFLQKAFGGHIRPQGQSENAVVWVRSLGEANKSFALSFLPSVVKHAHLKTHKIEAIIHHHRQRLSDQGATA